MITRGREEPVLVDFMIPDLQRQCPAKLKTRWIKKDGRYQSLRGIRKHMGHPVYIA